MLTRVEKRLRVHYPGAVAACARQLRVLPTSRAGQRVLREVWSCSPPANASREFADAFGNRVLELRHERLACEFAFELHLEVGTCSQNVPRDVQLPSEGIGAFLLPSALCDFGPRVDEALTQSGVTRGHAVAMPHETATQLCAWTHSALCYQVASASESAIFNASQILERKRGMCGEYATLFVALCRCAGLAARFVSGFNPAEGLMHAWAEVLCGENWMAFDPTHNRAPTLGTIVVACGRDARDVAAHSGTYRGPRGAQLNAYCRTNVMQF